MRAEDCIFFQLAKAGQAGARFWGQKVSGLGLTAAQAMVMRFLFDRDKLTSSELGSRTELDSATMTGILDRLEAAGLIERRPNPSDRRAILVHLTPKGRKTGEELAVLMKESNREFLQSFEAEDEKSLRALLGRIRQRQGE